MNKFLRPITSLRPNGTKRNFIDGLVNKRNPVPEKQKLFNANPHLHGADNPTWLKSGGDKATAMIGAGLAVVGTLALCRGMWNMAWGIGKFE